MPTENKGQKYLQSTLKIGLPPNLASVEYDNSNPNKNAIGDRPVRRLILPSVHSSISKKQCIASENLREKGSVVPLIDEAR